MEKQSSSHKTGMAEDRTLLAEDRTLLANERTLASWLRTALAAMGVAIGFHAVFGATEPTWLAKAVATAFIAAGVLICLTAARTAARTHDGLHAHNAALNNVRRLYFLAGLLTLAGTTAGVVLWML